MSNSSSIRRQTVAIALIVGLSACTNRASLPVAAGMGPDSTLPPPNPSWLLPTIDIAPVQGWPADRTPRPADGLTVAAFATGLDHPRWLKVLPNGDVLVAESNAPHPPTNAGFSLTRWFMGKVMARAGAGMASPDRIILLRDADGDGLAETRSVFLTGLTSPFGMALIGNALYVANTDALVRYPYTRGELTIGSPGVMITPLPAGPINYHWTRDAIASPDGSELYVTVGSNSNVGENGMDKERGRAAIWEVDPSSGNYRIFATGLRNPNGLSWDPRSGELWVAVNERDQLGGDLVPDFMTAVRDGGFYGWPWSYFGDHIDERVQPRRPDLTSRAIIPDYALGPHTGSLGLTFVDGSRLLPPRFNYGAFVGQHGSWNREPMSGYKVIFVPFRDGRPAGKAIDVLTEFLSDEGNAYGRPVGVAIDRKGALLVADDVGNTIWRVTASRSP